MSASLFTIFGEIPMKKLFEKIRANRILKAVRKVVSTVGILNYMVNVVFQNLGACAIPFLMAVQKTSLIKSGIVNYKN